MATGDKLDDGKYTIKEHYNLLLELAQWDLLWLENSLNEVSYVEVKDGWKDVCLLLEFE